tara:strand:+ start:409 stop:765 length:357 start_codon:yes stop_codon:yes gene_type:complete
MQNTDLNAIDALISELNSQIIRLPAADPEMVEKMLTALSIKLDNLAQEVRDQKSIDRQALQQAQVLLGVYSQQLAKAMARVQRGLEIFNLNNQVYQGNLPATGLGALPASISRRSLSA